MENWTKSFWRLLVLVLLFSTKPKSTVIGITGPMRLWLSFKGDVIFSWAVTIEGEEASIEEEEVIFRMAKSEIRFNTQNFILLSQKSLSTTL